MFLKRIFAIYNIYYGARRMTNLRMYKTSRAHHKPNYASSFLILRVYKFMKENKKWMTQSEIANNVLNRSPQLKDAINVLYKLGLLEFSKRKYKNSSNRDVKQWRIKWDIGINMKI